jgi:hypothetical protein
MYRQIQDAARYLNWEHPIDDWIELVKSVQRGDDRAAQAVVV